MNEKILILDDEETLCYFLKESLEEKGYRTVTAHTARDGLAALANQDVDLMLLDLKLPDGDGLSVLYEIRKSHSDLPVIVLTGHAAVESAVQAMKLGARDYLEKPINLARLSSSVAQALESRVTRSAQRLAERDLARAVPGEGALAEAALGDGRAQAESAELWRMYRKLERHVEELKALDSVSSHMMRSLRLHELLEATMEELVQVPSADMAAIFLRDAAGSQFVLASQRRFPASVFEDAALRWLPGADIVTRFSSHGDNPLSLEQAGPDPWVERLKGRLGKDTLGLLVPLKHDGKMQAIMVVGRRARQPFESSELKMFQSVAERLALAIEHAERMRALADEVTRLSEKRDLAESVLQSISDGLAVVDREGRVQLLNRAGERILGWRAGEVLGGPIDDLLGPGAGRVRECLERGLSCSDEEILARRHEGQSVPLGLTVSPLQDNSGTSKGAVVVLRDLTEARAVQGERTRLDRLAFLAEISSVMAHEIRNPLAGIGAGLQHLLTKFDEGDERRDAMERVLREGERVNAIIEDILLMSRPPHLSLAPCDVTEVIEDVLAESEETARARGIEIKKYLPPGLPPVKGDRTRLHQAFSSLILNGIEAMPEGGTLTLSVTGPGLGLISGGTGLADDSYVEIEIADTGTEFGEDDLGHIFEPFYRRKTRGQGLGLAIAGRIIDEHGGEVETESEEGVGTRFIARLPLARREE